MAELNEYIINWSDNSKTPFILEPREINENYSLTLLGKGADAGIWGELVNENFLHILESFSSESEPAGAIDGQIWHDSNEDTLKVYSNGVWRGLARKLDVDQHVVDMALHMTPTQNTIVDRMTDFGSSEVALNAVSNNALKLGGYSPSYYRHAANLSAGTLPTARLTGEYDIDISGEAADAAQATKLKTSRTFSISGDITSDSASFNGTGNVSLSINSLLKNDSSTYRQLTGKGNSVSNWVRSPTPGFLPSSNDGSHLGTNSWRWKEVHTNKLYVGGVLIEPGDISRHLYADVRGWGSTYSSATARSWAESALSGAETNDWLVVRYNERYDYGTGNGTATSTRNKYTVYKHLANYGWVKLV